MHQQIKGSPDDTATNIRTVLNALGKHNIDIRGIAPDFDAPHVRIAVKHNDPYEPSDPSDLFNRAIAAMEEEGLAPEVKPAVLLKIPDKPGALRAALSRLAREGYVAESILVLPGLTDDGRVQVSVGVASTMISGWDQASDELAARIEEDVDSQTGDASGSLPQG
jgi:hypothetical protein